MIFTGFQVEPVGIQIKSRVFRAKTRITIKPSYNSDSSMWTILLEEINITCSDHNLDNLIFTVLPAILVDRWDACAAPGTATPRDKDLLKWRNTLRSAFTEDIRE